MQLVSLYFNTYNSYRKVLAIGKGLIILTATRSDSDSRRALHELFPQKGVPQQIPAGLEKKWKFNLAWRLRKTFYDNFCILMINRKRTHSVVDKNYQQLLIQQIFLMYEWLIDHIQHLKFCKRCSFYAPSWLNGEEQLSQLGKSEHLFVNIKFSKCIIYR